MNNNIKQTMKKIYHDMALAELRLLNDDKSSGDLTYNDVLYITLIEAHDGEYTASTIADMLYVSRPAVTQKINELERKGYIYKKQSTTDKRVYYLFINKTEFSKEYQKTVEKTDNEIIKRLSSKYKPEQIAVFCEMTHIICDCFQNETKRGIK
ncbi:MAG: MarR family transcriptional regulator [Spirochaetales bacterium]